MTAAPEDALLPCPFCGGKAYLREDSRLLFVACLGADCFCTLGEGYDRSAMADHSFNSEQDAIAAWNMRTPSPVEAELVEALEQLTAVTEMWTANHADVTDGQLANATNQAVGRGYAAIARARPKTE